ncbi:MAG: C40 family peptidase [Crocinitomicaceae bacterium]|nr:C40 family peptidase [Crocinitomicaceae bacterium]
MNCRILFFLLGVSLFVTNNSFTQVKEFDMLELKYSQGLYRQVHKKARKLLDVPDHDYSMLPRYYYAITALQLAQNDRWFRRNQGVIKDAREYLVGLNRTIDGRRLLLAHQEEMSALKNDLKQWASDAKVQGDTKKFDWIQNLLEEIFKDIPSIEKIEETPITKPFAKDISISAKRALLIAESQKHLGTPYKWAGVDPKGFDCSGFTYYLMKEYFNQELSRRSKDQYVQGKKVKRKNVQPGDFVFFDNGSGISHVGIIIKNADNELLMIHSSTSQGISIVDIEKSSYWKPRLYGFATFLAE